VKALWHERYGEPREVLTLVEHAPEAPGQTRKEFFLKEVARNTLEPYNACPIFEGDRLYLRGNSKLYCIAAPEADKKEAQALLQAQDDKKAAAAP
jgi:thiaminase